MLMGICSSKQEVSRLCQDCFTYVCRLVDPYVQPMLIVRAPGSDSEQVHRFENDDPFFSEASEIFGMGYQVVNKLTRYPI